MTLAELNATIDIVAKMTELEKAEAEEWEKTPHDPADVYAPNYMSRLWEDMPRLHINELPPELKECLRGLDDVDRWRRFLLEVFPVGALDTEMQDPEALEAKIRKAMEIARYQVTRITQFDEATKQNVQWFSVSLRGDDLLEAWKAAGGTQPTAMDMAAAKRKTKLAAQPPQLVNVKTPKTHVMPTSKLAIMTGAILNAERDVELDVSRGRKGKTFVRVLMTYEGGDIAISSRKPITSYDISVNDTAASLWEYGNDDHTFTPAMLCRAMMGMTAKENPSEQQITEAVESLERQAAVRVTVDCTEQLKAHGITEIDGYQIRGGKIRTNLLMVEAIELDTTGGRVMGYHMLKPPIRYEYSKLLGQVASVPIKYLDVKETKIGDNHHVYATKKRVNNNRQRIAIKEYLLRRICIMKGKSKTSNRILLDTVYKEIGLDAPTDKMRRSIKEYIEKVLLYWIAEGFIDGYEIHKDGRSFAGFDIKY